LFEGISLIEILTGHRTGGIATAILTSPLDVLRTRLQSDFYHTQHVAQASKHMNLSLPRTFILHFQETFDTLIAIHRVEGWRCLFKGLGPSMTGVVPATAIKFYTYGNCKRILPDILSVEPNSSVVHLLSATSAGIVTGTATNPIWLVKTRLQLDKSRVTAGKLQERQYKNSLDCVRQVIQQEGVKGLYRGLTASYLGVVETALHLTVYERLKNTLTEATQTPGQPHQSNSIIQGLALSSAAGLSKLFAVLVAYPHEV
jgi:solute carrier family 25, member 33/36